MDERRVAVAAAGALLAGLGIYIIALPRGVVFGAVCIVLGVLIFVPAAVVAVVEFARAERGPVASKGTEASEMVVDTARPRARTAIGPVSWSRDTPWSTTPLAVAVRGLLVTALTLVLLLQPPSFFDPAPDRDLPDRLISVATVTITALILGFTPWVIERIKRPTYLVTRSEDLTAVVPVLAGLTLVLLLGWLFHPISPWTLAIPFVQAAWTLSTAVLLRQRLRRLETTQSRGSPPSTAE